ncbi:MAG: hypothetical protein LBP28_09145 [Coriobacteriales bacterium]|jgi:hypothetical protein|nr:hypothetical protein [Coriobacteriales bacterium]
MNDKLLLSIRCAAAEQTREFWVPRCLTLGQATQLVARIFLETDGAFFSPTDSLALLRIEDGEELPADRLVGQLSLHNGSTLFLV